MGDCGPCCNECDRKRWNVVEHVDYLQMNTSCIQICRGRRGRWGRAAVDTSVVGSNKNSDKHDNIWMLSVSD